MSALDPLTAIEPVAAAVVSLPEAPVVAATAAPARPGQPVEASANKAGSGLPAGLGDHLYRPRSREAGDPGE